MYLKMYRATFRPQEGSNYSFCRYYMTYKEAINDCERYTGYKAETKRRRVVITSHHTALARGYVRKGCSYNEYYVGKFGEGFISHYANCDRGDCSNSYHLIEYFIELS